MRIVALYGRDGVIRAAAAVEAGYRGPVPVASKDTEVSLFDVPESAVDLRLDEICATCRVDSDRRRLVHSAPETASTRQKEHPHRS